MLLVCLLVQVGTTVSAQHAELKWLRGWKGGRAPNNNTHNALRGMVVDEEGNTYVAGELRDAATFLDGTHASELDDTMPPCQTHGVIVAKYDTAGNLIWRKSCRSTLDGNQSSMNVTGLEKSGDRLYLLMGMTLGANDYSRYDNCPLGLWFFDTVYYWPFDHVNNPNPHYNHMGMPWAIPDTLRHFPFNEWNGVRYSMFVVFDLDGNRLEQHSITCRRPREQWFDTTLSASYRAFLTPWKYFLLYGRFVVDSEKNICIFVDGNYGSDFGWTILNGWDIVLDDDTSRVLTYDEIYGCTGDGYDSALGHFHFIKIDSNWNFVEAKRLTQRLDTRQLVPYPNLHDTARAARHWDVVGVIIAGLSIDEEDNIYLEGALRTVESYWPHISDTLEVDYPYRVFFDSTHYVTVGSFATSHGIPIYAKYDSDGNLLWLNQMYLQTEDRVWAKMVSNVLYNDYGCASMRNHKKSLNWDSNYVYSKVELIENWSVLCNLFPGYSTTNPDRGWIPHYWYLDSNHTMLVTLPDSHAAMDIYRQYLGQDNAGIEYGITIVLVYDRETGAPVRYINPFETIPPIQICERANPGSGKIITTDDDLLIGCERKDQHGRTERHLLRYNKSSGVTTLLDSNCAHAAHMLENLHPDGWLMGREPTTRSNASSCSNFHLYDGTQNAVYASCYYLPDFDRRRPVVVECPPVEEVRVTHVVEDDVTLAWHGGANHGAWQVAYLPTDAATDSTVWEHALLVETTDTTLTLPLDTCSQLRVRGICDAEHSGPWSDAVEACPQPHIGIAGGARQSSGPVLIPNPATEVVTVVDGATGVIERQVMEIEIVSPLGQTVMHLRGASLFNVADLASGTYMVKIRTPRGTTLRKLTIR